MEPSSSLATLLQTLYLSPQFDVSAFGLYVSDWMPLGVGGLGASGFRASSFRALFLFVGLLVLGLPVLGWVLHIFKNILQDPFYVRTSSTLKSLIRKRCIPVLGSLGTINRKALKPKIQIHRLPGNKLKLIPEPEPLKRRARTLYDGGRNSG